MTLALYQKHLDALDDVPITGRIMPYNWINLPNPLSGTWMVYAEMLGDFARELANIINSFSHDIRKLQAWAALMPTFSETERAEAAREFTDVLATHLVASPYVIKSRFGFAAAHLCHQANRTKDGAAWKDNLPEDKDIWPGTAHKYGERWSTYNSFRICLEAIGDEAFQTATDNFRHIHNHRFPSRFAIGLTQSVARHVEKSTGKVWYGIGGKAPLDLGVVCGLLIEQRDRSYEAYDAFQTLVRVQEAVIAAA